jgi:ribosomal protein L11 methyltransferase
LKPIKNMNYIELLVRCDGTFCDILQAELAELGFEAFAEEERGFAAYAPVKAFDKGATEGLLKQYMMDAALEWEVKELEKVNWNEEWEKNYEAIEIGQECIVRANFHPPRPDVPYEIVITPKMSFGTGHHQTTRLMLQQQLHLEHEGLRVLDVGCGTGILAIMAHKRGAVEIWACDIDEWSVENSRENCCLNRCPEIQVVQGTLAASGIGGEFDIILANINKNVLLEEMDLYAEYLLPNGHLLLSGFYEQDIDDLLETASGLGFEETGRFTAEKGWASLQLVKRA